MCSEADTIHNALTEYMYVIKLYSLNRHNIDRMWATTLTPHCVVFATTCIWFAIWVPGHRPPDPWYIKPHPFHIADSKFVLNGSKYTHPITRLYTFGTCYYLLPLMTSMRKTNICTYSAIMDYCRNLEYKMESPTTIIGFLPSNTIFINNSTVSMLVAWTPVITPLRDSLASRVCWHITKEKIRCMIRAWLK